MQAIDFKEANITIAKDQPQYIPLPAYVKANDVGEIVCCWKLTRRERLKLFFTGNLWVSVLTFGGLLQPLKLTVHKKDLIDHA